MKETAEEKVYNFWAERFWVEQKASSEPDLPPCAGCGLREDHKMCVAHGTEAYMNQEHPAWGDSYRIELLKECERLRREHIEMRRTLVEHGVGIAGDYSEYCNYCDWPRGGVYLSDGGEPTDHRPTCILARIAKT